MEKKLSMEELIAKADAAKKANPLDLSSDQDLSIAIMNLVSLEEHFFFSGGKTGKAGFYDLINVVREMRKDLMARLVKKSGPDDGEIWCISKHLLAASMRLLEVGTKALGAGKKSDAADLFAKAYDLYSLFWGVNMGLVDLAGVKKNEDLHPGLRDWVGDACNGPAKPESETNPPNPESRIANPEKSLLGSLGSWVKKAVNCCIE